MKFAIDRKVPFAVLALFASCASAPATEPGSPIAVENYKAPIRLACVGDSITVGVGTSDHASQSYPSQLKRMLDEHWQVSNFGVSGATLLNSGDKPYQKQAAFQNALKLSPDVVVIMLGTNDSKPQNWKFKDQFAADYKDLIEKFKSLPSHPQVFICDPVPVPGAGNYGINEAGVQEEIPMLEKVAREEGTGLIDLHGALAGKDGFFPDRVHPNVDGAAAMAKTVFKALTGKEFSGEIPGVVHPQ